MTALNLKTTTDRCLPPTNDPNKTDFKVAYMVLLKKHTMTTAFNTKNKPSYRVLKQLSNKAFDICYPVNLCA